MVYPQAAVEKVMRWYMYKDTGSKNLLKKFNPFLFIGGT